MTLDASSSHTGVELLPGWFGFAGVSETTTQAKTTQSPNFGRKAGKRLRQERPAYLCADPESLTPKALKP